MLKEKVYALKGYYFEFKIMNLIALFRNQPEVSSD